MQESNSEITGKAKKLSDGRRRDIQMKTILKALFLLIDLSAVLAFPKSDFDAIKARAEA